MQITIIDVSQEVQTKTAKGGYGSIEVTYKDSYNKVANKKLMSFNHPEVYKAMKAAQKGAVLEVETKKNDAGYWDWTAISPTGASSQVPSASTVNAGSSTGGTSRGGTYETQEERAKKQTYIIKQSSLSNAVETLSVGAKAPLKPEDVKKVAQDYVDWVLGTDVRKELTIGKDSLEDDFDNDVPM